MISYAECPAVRRLLASCPDIDRKLLEEGLRPRDFFDDRETVSLRPSSINTIASTYLLWLKMLRKHGCLDETKVPADRVIPTFVAIFVRERLNSGNRTTSIVACLRCLRYAMRIMQPERDFRWLTCPRGQPLSRYLPASSARLKRIIHSRVLYEWGLELIRASEQIDEPIQRALVFRDGLLIAILAARAPRLRSLSRFRLGKHVIKVGEKFRLVLEQEDLKAGPPLEYGVPLSLDPIMEQYLTVRQVLLRGQHQDAFWIGRHGRPLAASTISQLIRRRSKKQFGFSFGPHRFRHGIGTSAPLEDPSHPGIAPAILHHTGDMAKFYNVADAATAAARLQASLKEVRADTKSLAEREFRKRRTRLKPGKNQSRFNIGRPSDSMSAGRKIAPPLQARSVAGADQVEAKHCSGRNPGKG